MAGGEGTGAAVAEAPAAGAETEGMTYEAAGVNIEAGNSFTREIKRLIEEAWPEMKGRVGSFAGLADLPEGAKQFAASVDGTGTKILLAAMVKNFSAIGQDAAAMGVLDTYVDGCLPRFVLDTLNLESLDEELHIEIIKSLIAACQLVGATLIGGETAELPGTFRHKWGMTFDITSIGFPIPDFSYVPVRPGQLIYGRPSNGVGANGFSLVRKVFGLDERPSRARKKLERSRPEFDGASLADVLLEPVPIYIPECEQQRLLGTKFAAHINVTGGGLRDNIPRKLPQDCKALIRRDKWTRPRIFSVIEQLGNVSEEQMLKTFNNGVMLASFVEGQMTDVNSFEIGEIVARKGNEPQVEFVGNFVDEG